MTTPAHLSFEVHEASQVGEVRRAATQWAAREGMDEVRCGRVALVVTELGSNLVRHAQQGRLLVGLVPTSRGPAFEVIALDRGPGIRDWRVCLADGYSTGGTAGTGLGAVRRLADEFDAYSHMPGGSVIMARLSLRDEPHDDAARSRDADAADIDVGGISLPVQGETACGDGWTACFAPGRAAVLVADGLGHGPDAAEASQAAMAVFQASPFLAPSESLGRIHEALRRTRGAAVFQIEVDPSADALCYGGAGNVVGRVLSGVEDRSLVSQHGTAGLQIRRVVDTRSPWPPHAVLVLHSDGLVSRWTLDEAPGLLQHHPAVIAAWLLRDHSRGRDDVTVVVLKRRPLR